MKSKRKLFISVFLAFLLASVLAPLITQTTQTVKADGENWLTGWDYRKSHIINPASGAGTNYQVPITVYKSAVDSFYSLSGSSSPISGTDHHGFDIAHTTNIVQCNKTVDGSVRKYLAYDSNIEGSLINLYYSDNLNSTWTAYSGNPILSGANLYRSPSVAYVGGTFQMFQNAIGSKNVERWTSADGISFTKAETVLTTANDQWTAPFIWLNPNDNRWYLFWTDDNTAGSYWSIKARNSTDITNLASQTDTTVISTTTLQYFAYPTIMYRDGTYWLVTEAMPGAGTNPWNVNVFKSSSVTSGYSQTSDSPILTNDEACPQIFIADNGVDCYLFTNQNQTSNLWYQLRRTVNSLSNDYVSTDGHCQNDFDDIRFTSSDGSTELNYALTNKVDGSYAQFWVKVSADLSSSSQTIYLYYGNSSVTTTNNGTNTFLLYDTFDSAVDWTNKWQSTNQSSYTISSGTLRCAVPSLSSQMINSLNSFSSFAVSCQIRASVSPNDGTAFLSESSVATYSGLDSAWLQWTGAGSLETYLYGNSSVVAQAPDTSTNWTVKYYCPSSGSATMEIYNGTILKVTNSHAPAYRTAYVSFLAWAGSQIGYVDNVTVRKYVNPEPVQGAWGTEEAESSPSDTYTLTQTVVNPQNIIYNSSTIPVQISVTGNDTNPVATWNVKFSNGSWLYGTNQTYTSATTFTLNANLIATFCALVIGDNLASDYDEVVFTVSLPATTYTIDLITYSPANTTYTRGSIPISISLSTAGNDTVSAYSWNIRFSDATWLYLTNQTTSSLTVTITENDTLTFCCHVVGIHGSEDYQEVVFTTYLTDISVPPSISVGWAWQYLFAGDVIGFFSAMLTAAFSSLDLAVGVIAMVFLVPLYIRTKSLLLICIAWILIGGFLIALMPLVSGVAILFMALGIAGLLWRLFRPSHSY